MSQAKATIIVRYSTGTSAVLEIQGEITALAETMLMNAYTQASAASARAIVLNFSGLKHMNSGGISLLVRLFIQANRHGQQLLACGLNEHFQYIFKLTRLNEAIRIYETEAEALAAVD